MTAHRFLLLLPALLLAGCASLLPPPGPDDRQQAARLAGVAEQLDGLDSLDAVVHLDNDLLRTAMEAQLRDALAEAPGWRTDSLRIDFHEGTISLRLEGVETAGAEPTVRRTLSGELLPVVLSDGLAWRARLDPPTLPQAAGEGTWADPVASGGDGEDASLFEVLQAALDAPSDTRLELAVLPQTILETGIRLRSPLEAVVSESHVVGGVTTTEGSAVLIGPETTLVALDLGFVTGLPECAGSLGVGRATFASSVQNREPIGRAGVTARLEQVQVFFTDITQAREPTTVVHYWFADGQPVAVVRLDVQPSARWRTWSSRPTDANDARHWQVLVVEEATGCILASRSVHVPVDALPSAAPGPDAERLSYDALRGRLRGRGEDLFGELERGAVAELRTDRRFFSDAVAASLYDLRIESTRTVPRTTGLPIDARVSALPETAVSCERRECESERTCTLDYDDCPVRQDTRDCTSCLLRNPLNNRCMREAEDPICLAARDAENDRLAQKREACIAWQTRKRDACLESRARELRSCRERATTEVDTCAAQAEAMADRHRLGQPLARLKGDTVLAGDLTFGFGDFRLEDGLQRLRMVLSLDADLSASGQLRLTPVRDLGVLARCVQPSEAPVTARLSMPGWQGGLAAQLEPSGSALVANWSGLVQRMDAELAAPYEVFAGTLGSLAACELEVEAEALPAVLAGPGADLLRGRLDLDLQPEPTRLQFLPAYLRWGERSWSGEARVERNAVRYSLRVDDTSD